MTINLLRKKKVEGKIKKLIVIGRSTGIEKVRKHRKPFPLADTGRKAREAPLILADIGPLDRSDRPEDQINWLGRLEDPTIKSPDWKRNCMK
jgi:hypothetical protein